MHNTIQIGYDLYELCIILDYSVCFFWTKICLLIIKKIQNDLIYLNYCSFDSSGIGMSNFFLINDSVSSLNG